MIATRRRSPGFVTGVVAAVVASFLAWILVALLAIPLALAAATGAALGSPSGGSLAALSIAGLLLLLAQPLVAAGLLRVFVSAVANAQLGYGVAALAMFASLVVTLIAAAALPAGAAAPALGFSWTGALAAGWVVSK
jgi:hypothetical protein